MLASPSKTGVLKENVLKRAEILLPLGIVVLNGWMLVETLRKLPYAVEGVPGPGFLPFWLSLAIIVLGLVLTVRVVRAEATDGGEVEWPDGEGWLRIAIMLALLAMSLFLLNWLGFFAVAVLYVALGGYGMGMRSWRVLVPVSLLMALGIYVVFGVWLKVPLPKGILGL
jgi:putative tricarboxylic transport membrane protein